MTREKVSLGALLLVAFNLRPALASLGPLLETLRDELQLSRSEAGWLSALPILCMGVCAPLAVSVQRRVGLHRAIGWGCLLLGACLLLRAWPQAAGLWISSVGAGVMIAVLAPWLNSYLKWQFGASATRISAWSTTALCLGAALGAAFSIRFSQWWGWSMALAAWGVPALLAALYWWRAAPVAVMSQQATPVGLPWCDLRAWVLILCFGLNSLVFYALLAWLAPVYVELGRDAAQSGQLLGVFALAQLSGTLLVSVLPSRMIDRRPVLFIAGAVILAGLLAMFYQPGALPWLWMVLLGAGTAGMFALTLLLPLDYTQTPADAGAWTAMMSAGGYVIAATGPVLAGWVRDHSASYANVFAMLIGLTLVSMLASMLLAPSPSRTLNHHAL